MAEAECLWSTHKNSDLGISEEGFSFVGQTQARPLLTACPALGRSRDPNLASQVVKLLVWLSREGVPCLRPCGLEWTLQAGH